MKVKVLVSLLLVFCLVFTPGLPILQGLVINAHADTVSMKDTPNSSIANIEALRIAQYVCTTRANPILITVDLPNIDISEITVSYNIPLLDKKHHYDSSSFKYVLDSGGKAIIYFEVPALCSMPKNGYDFTRTYNDEIVISIPSQNISKKLQGTVSYISDSRYNKIASQFSDKIDAEINESLVELINDINKGALDTSIELSKQCVDKMSNQLLAIKKFNERVQKMNDKEFNALLKKVKGAKLYTKSQFAAEMNGYVTELTKNRAEASNTYNKLNNTRSTLKFLKSSANVLEIVDNINVKLSLYSDFEAIGTGMLDIIDNNNIMAKKYTGFLAVITAEGDILGIALSIKGMNQAVRTAAKKALGGLFIAGLCVGVAEMSVDVRTKAVEQVEGIILQTDALRDEYELQKLDLFLEGRQDRINGKPNKLSVDNLNENLRIYNLLVSDYQQLIKLMDSGAVRYAYREDAWDLISWIGILGLDKLHHNAADTYKSTYQLSLKQLEKDTYKYLATFYDAGYNNQTGYLKFIYIDDYNFVPTENTQGLDPQLKSYIPSYVKNYQYAYLNMKGDSAKEALISWNNGGYGAFEKYGCCSKIMIFERKNNKWTLVNEYNKKNSNSDEFNMNFLNNVYLGNLTINGYDAPVFLIYGELYSYHYQSIDVLYNSKNMLKHTNAMLSYMINITDGNKPPQTVISENKLISIDNKKNTITINEKEYTETQAWDGSKLSGSVKKKTDYASANLTLSLSDGIDFEEYCSNSKKSINVKVGDIIYFKEMQNGYGYDFLMLDESDAGLYQWTGHNYVKMLKKGTFTVWERNYSKYFIFVIN